jgi:cell division protein FtsN
VWSQMIDVQVNALDRAPTRTAEPPPRIVLAREAQEFPAKADNRESPDVEPPLASAIESPTQSTARINGTEPFTCTSVGPFADLAEASQAQASLRGAGFSPQQRVEQGELWVGYWVSVQDLATREAADAAMQALQANGISDVYLMPAGERGHTLSLGVFSDHQRAQRRTEQARALGLDARIEDRKRAGSVYWLDVELSEPGQVIDTSIFQSDPGKIMRLELRQCPGEA